MELNMKKDRVSFVTQCNCNVTKPLCPTCAGESVSCRQWTCRLTDANSKWLVQNRAGPTPCGLCVHTGSDGQLTGSWSVYDGVRRRTSRGRVHMDPQLTAVRTPGLMLGLIRVNYTVTQPSGVSDVLQIHRWSGSRIVVVVQVTVGLNCLLTSGPAEPPAPSSCSCTLEKPSRFALSVFLTFTSSKFKMSYFLLLFECIFKK